jgi:hypothetical protein
MWSSNGQDPTMNAISVAQPLSRGDTNIRPEAHFADLTLTAKRSQAWFAVAVTTACDLPAGRTNCLAHGYGAAWMQAEQPWDGNH